MVFKSIFCVFSGFHPKISFTTHEHGRNLIVQISIFLPFSPSRWQRRRGEFEERPKWHAGIEQEAAKGQNCLHGPSTSDTWENIRAAEISERSGPNGTGEQAGIDWYAGQNVVSKQKVNIDFLIEANKNSRHIKILFLGLERRITPPTGHLNYFMATPRTLHKHIHLGVQIFELFIEPHWKKHLTHHWL